MSQTITDILTLDIERCCECGVSFGIPSTLLSSLRQTRAWFYCPNGHRLCYAETESQILKKQLEAKERELTASKCATLNERMAKEQEQIARARAERKLKRNQRGVCTCCNRTFINLQRHMATKHPIEA